MGAIASQITGSLTIVYSIVNSGADQRKHQSSASLAFVWGIHRRPVNFPHKWPVTRKKFPFDDVIMSTPWRCAKRNMIYIALKWRHDMEMLSVLPTLCEWNPPVIKSNERATSWLHGYFSRKWRTPTLFPVIFPFARAKGIILGHKESLLNEDNNR